MTPTKLTISLVLLALVGGCLDPVSGGLSDTASDAVSDNTVAETALDAAADVSIDQAATETDAGTETADDVSMDAETTQSDADGGLVDVPAETDVADDVPDADGDSSAETETEVASGCQPAACDDSDPCNGVEFCRPDGSCGNGPPPACAGSCETGQCTPGVGCAIELDGGFCADPLDWARELLGWDGRPAALRDAVQASFVQSDCGFVCAQTEDPPSACFSFDLAGSQTCTAPSECGDTSVVGTVDWSETSAEVCNEFDNFAYESLTVADFFFKFTKSPFLSLPAGTAELWTQSYYGSASTNWSTDITVGRDGSTGVFPGWVLWDASTTIAAAGSSRTYSPGYEDFFSSGEVGHTSSGEATATMLGGVQYTANWTMDWKAAWLDEATGTAYGCDLEPVGSMTVGVDMGGDAFVEHVITFQGIDGCDGCATHVIDGAQQPDLWCGALPTLFTYP